MKRPLSRIILDSLRIDPGPAKSRVDEFCEIGFYLIRASY